MAATEALGLGASVSLELGRNVLRDGPVSIKSPTGSYCDRHAIGIAEVRMVFTTRRLDIHGEGYLCAREGKDVFISR